MENKAVTKSVDLDALDVIAAFTKFIAATGVTTSENVSLATSPSGCVTLFAFITGSERPSAAATILGTKSHISFPPANNRAAPARSVAKSFPFDVSALPNLENNAARLILA